MKENHLDHEEASMDNIEPNEAGYPRRSTPFIKVVAFVCLLAFLGLALPEISILMKGMPSFLKQAHSLSQQDLVRISTPSVVVIDSLVIENVISVNRHSGTGFNINSEGLIVSNQHVVNNARELTVTFPDGRFITTNNYRSLPGMDIAIVSLNAKDLPYLESDFNRLPEPGEILTIIGNPAGYESIPVQGPLLGYRSLSSIDQPVMIIDASIAPGNSGSPVLNSQGKVVGVVFASTGAGSQALAISFKGLDQYFYSSN